MAKKAIPKIDITKHPEFRVVHVTGAFGSLKADEGFIQFYCDILEPRMKSGSKPGQMELEKITREFQIEVRMTSAEYVKMANWMMAHIKELEKKGIMKVEKKPSKGEEAYRV